MLDPEYLYDKYKVLVPEPQIQLYTAAIVPFFKTIHRCLDSSCASYDANLKSTPIDGQCSLKHCSDICASLEHMYSEGCGPQQDNNDLSNIWLENIDSEVEFEEHIKLSELELRLQESAQPEQELEAYEIIHHGKCVECQLCTSV